MNSGRSMSPSSATVFRTASSTDGAAEALTDAVAVLFAAPKMAVESTESGQPGALATPGVCAFFDSVGYDH